MIRSVLRHIAFYPLKALLPILALGIFGVISCLPPSTRAGTTFYSVHVGSYKNLQNALKETSRLQEAGRNAFYRHDVVKGNGKLYRVYVGEHDEREGAELEGRILKALDIASVSWIRAIPEVTEDDTPEKVHRQKGFVLHLGSFQVEGNAEREVQRLDQEGYHVSSLSVTIANKTWFRVFLGNYPDEKAARRAGEDLNRKGIISYFRPQRIPAELRAEETGRRIRRADSGSQHEAPLGIKDSNSQESQPGIREIENKRWSPSQENANFRSAVDIEKKKLYESAEDEECQFDFRGQLSAWAIETRDRGAWSNNSGLRYIPQLSVEIRFGDSSLIGAEVSANSFAAYESSNQDRDPELKLYRLKLRYATAQTETRIGLQKINFGPAYLLRPLRWFDQLDPRDPLQLTDGVHALRFRYDTMNNAGFWFWALYDNDRLKGYEVFPTSNDKPELGWRFQFPIPRGEAGITFHTRQADAIALSVREFRENRYALDGRWDVGVGLWFESVFQQQEMSNYPYEWQKMTTIGMDYTLGIGSGLHILGEHMVTAVSDAPFQWDEDFHVSAFSLSYSIGFFDSVSAIGYYTWDSKDYYQYLGWQRTYDNFIIQLSGFHYPESSGTDGGISKSAMGAGYGGRLMVIYNH